VILRSEGAELARATLPPGEYVIGRSPGDLRRHHAPLAPARPAQRAGHGLGLAKIVGGASQPRAAGNAGLGSPAYVASARTAQGDTRRTESDTIMA